MPIDPDLLQLLCCPFDRGELIQKDNKELICSRCKRRFPIKYNIPFLRKKDALPEE